MTFMAISLHWEAVLEEVVRARVEQVVVGGDVSRSHALEVFVRLLELDLPFQFIVRNDQLAVFAEMNGMDFGAPARYRDNIRWNATASPVGWRIAEEMDRFRARLDLLSQPLLGRVGAQLEVPLLAEPLERALQVSTIYFVATTESTQSDVLKPRAN
jgi:hypothetical protein